MIRRILRIDTAGDSQLPIQIEQWKNTHQGTTLFWIDISQGDDIVRIAAEHVQYLIKALQETLVQHSYSEREEQT